MRNRLVKSYWTDEEKEDYKQFDNPMLSELYSSRNVTEDPELREEFLLGYLGMSRKEYYDCVRHNNPSLELPFKLTCLNLLEGLVIIDNEALSVKSN